MGDLMFPLSASPQLHFHVCSVPTASISAERAIPERAFCRRNCTDSQDVRDHSLSVCLILSCLILIQCYKKLPRLPPFLVLHPDSDLSLLLS